MVTTVSYMLQKKKIPAESESNLCDKMFMLRLV